MNKGRYYLKPEKQQHIVVLMGAKFQAEGANNFVLNVVREWKKFGHRVTVICQDRNAKNLPIVDSYIEGEFPRDTEKLKNGQVRIYIPNLQHGIMPYYASQQFIQYKEVEAKMFHEMTDQEVQMSIKAHIPSLRAVCIHDRPLKVVGKYILLCGQIFDRALRDLNIPYNMIILGPALTFSFKPYPELWKKWVLQSLRHVENFYIRTQLIKKQVLKIFKQHNEQYQLQKKIRIIQPSVNMNKLKIPQSYFQQQQNFLGDVKKSLNKHNSKNTIKNNLQFCKNFDADELNNYFVDYWQKNQKNLIQGDLLQKWIKYSEDDETILYVGSLLKNKGVGELLIIAPKLITIKPNLKFIFCGSGPYKQHMLHMLDAFQEGNFQKAQLIAKAGQFVSELNIQDHFLKIDKKVRERIIFTGLLQLPTIYSLMPLCTVIVTPSRAHENYCMRTIQGLCFGLTPIINDHSWFTQMLNHIDINYPQLVEVIRVNREQFFHQLPETIIKTLQFIKHNRLKKQLYREKLRKIVSDHFSWTNTASIIIERPAQSISSNESNQEETNFHNQLVINE